MMNIFYRLIIIVLLTVCFPAKADLLSATLDYNDGNYSEAFAEFSRLAKLGNEDAIFNVGVMFLHGQGVEQDLAQANAWFRLAADFGLDEARDAAQLIAAQTEHSTLEQAYQTLQKSISFRQFEQTLQPIFSAEKFTEKNTEPPLRIHTVDAKYPQSAYEKGIEGWVWLEFDVDASGAVKDVDIIDAFPDKTFNRAIYNAVRRWRYEPYRVDGVAQNYSSRSLLYHFTTFKGKRYKASFASQKKQYQRKISELIESAEQGNALVQYYIANWLNADEHNATKLLRYHWQQDTASSDLLLKSAINGYPNSQYRLGTNLLRGEFTQTDRKKGLNWILNAAQSGFVYAQYRLGRELLDKRFVEYDQDKAKRWLTMAANQGHFRAQRDLIDVLIENEEFVQAVNYLTLALEHDAQHPDLWFSQSKMAIKRGDKALASDAINKAIKYAKEREWHLAKLQAYQQQHKL